MTDFSQYQQFSPVSTEPSEENPLEKELEEFFKGRTNYRLKGEKSTIVNLFRKILQEEKGRCADENVAIQRSIQRLATAGKRTISWARTHRSLSNLIPEFFDLIDLPTEEGGLFLSNSINLSLFSEETQRKVLEEMKEFVRINGAKNHTARNAYIRRRIRYHKSKSTSSGSKLRRYADDLDEISSSFSGKNSKKTHLWEMESLMMKMSCEELEGVHRSLTVTALGIKDLLDLIEKENKNRSFQ